MAATAGSMIDETLGLLESWSLNEQQSATLAAPIVAGDVTGAITGARGIATGMTAGVIEIDRELIYADTVSDTGFTVPAWGRGYKSTTAASHAAGARIISQPTFPRQKIFDYLNQSISRVFPELYAVKSHETTTTFPVRTYNMPADCMRILKIKWLVPDGRSYWQDVRRWRLSAGGGTQFGDMGISVDIAEEIQSGRPIQFLYAAQPSPLVNDTDVFGTTTGLGTGLVDVIEIGAAATAAQALEMARLQAGSIEQQARSSSSSPGEGMSAAQYLDKRFLQRVAEERQTLQVLYPPRITRGWM